MKNFFKKLAFMLALLMVVSTATPTAPVQAAAAPVLNTSGKVLYLDGDETGKYTDTFTLKVWNKGDYRVTYKSLTPEIAEVSKWWGTVTAKAVGTATIEATVTDLKTGKEVAVLTSKVWVKNNAEEVGFSTASVAKVEDALTIGDSVKLNAFRKDGDTVAWSTKKDEITDYIVYESSDPSVATVSKWGTVTAVGAGEATITATAYQTEGKTATTTSASVKVTVKAPGLVATTQKNVTTANLVAGDALSADDFNKDTVKVYSLVGNTKVAQVVKAVTIDSADATKATVELYVGFAKNTTYVIEYKDTAVEFLAVDPSADSVKSIVINTNEAVKGEATEIKYSLYTENGVDITSAIDGRVDFTTTSNDCYIDNSSKKITFFETGKVAEVKAEFHTWKYTDAGTEQSITTSTAIKSVDAASYELGAVKAWTFDTDNAFNFDKDTVNQKLSLSESSTGRYLIAKFVKNDSDKTVVLSNSDSKFSFEASDTNVLVVSGNQVFPVKTGSVTVIVKYDGKAIDAINVTVLPKRAAATLTATVDKSIVSLDQAWDVATVKFEVKDQLGDKFEDNKVKIQLLSCPTGAAYPFSKDSSTEITGGKLELNGSQFSKEGSYQYKVTAGDITKIFSVTLKEASTTSTQKLELSTKEVDTTFKLTTEAGKNSNKDVAIKLYDVDASGVKVSPVSASALLYGKDAAVAAVKDTAKATAYYYEVIDTDGKAIGADNLAINTAEDKFCPVTVSGSSISKVKAGTYKVAAYKITTDANKAQTVTALGLDYVTVKDSQVAATVEQKKVNSSSTSLLGALTNGDIVIKLDTNNDSTADEIQGAVKIKEFVGKDEPGNTVFLKTVTYDAQVNYDGTVYTYTMTIDVNKNITLAK